MDMKVQGKDRLYVKFVAEQLGLDGSYVPRTYIEQIQLEKLVNDVMALPDDLKTKLSIDDDFAASPKEALSRASADRRMKHIGLYSQFFYNLIYFPSKLRENKRWKRKYMNKCGN
ncbi:inorganic pyrophosphatase TTM1-like [Humulus lupulus]|uniref:inorganic pyrophosphatase TTM1-like n=1 Tax=Humulus lupulus TaxID=3486 RepID=UPI002B40697C|nr:inorganic pyrophosphatase TTM1-like [Humulus lupulus]